MYYLGEIARAEEKGEPPKIKVGEEDLFVVTRNEKNPTVSVKYEGIEYCIPSDQPIGSNGKRLAGRSMQVLSFVSLLIAQQKSGINLPVTQTVVPVGLGR